MFTRFKDHPRPVIKSRNLSETSKCSPGHPLPDELLGGGVAELLDQVLPHVPQADQLGVQQVELHPVQEVAEPPGPLPPSSLTSIASTRPPVSSSGSVTGSVRVLV